MIRRGMWAGLVALVGAGLGLPMVALGDDAPERQSAFTARPELEPAFFDVVRKDAAESVRAERVRAEQRKHMMFGLVVYMEPMPTGLLPAFGECFIQTQKSNSGRRVLPQAAAADADTREQFDIKQIDINDPHCLLFGEWHASLPQSRGQTEETKDSDTFREPPPGEAAVYLRVSAGIYRVR